MTEGLALPLGAEEAVDLFAGPGGWDAAAYTLGLRPLGIEWDDAACATRETAGLRTLQADVAELTPASFAPVKLVIASPPCPTFSKAGLREGIADLPLVWAAAKAVAAGEPVPDQAWRDERSALVVQPLRWALQLEPTFCAWEQVPEVLPFWQFCAGVLRDRGYSAWAGVLESECYGVAQTRSRAFLMASRVGHVEPPTPTHQRYVKGEGQREDATLEGIVHPWVSMSEALGWHPEDEVGFPRRNDTASNKPGPEDDGEYRERDRRPASEPAFTLGEKARSWDRIVLRNGNQDRATVRGADEPAPTIAFGHAADSVEWVETDNVTKEGTEKYKRPTDAPAPTVTTRADLWTRNRPAPTITTGSARCEGGILVYPHWRGEEPPPDWTRERPSTTVLGDPRIPAPGHKKDADFPDAPGRMEGAVKVTLEEAAVLQSFPPDYPFQGSKTKRFEQVGNAVPPLLARAVLAKLLSL